jgi:NADH-quinone oxidoreductase subunit I
MPLQAFFQGVVQVFRRTFTYKYPYERKALPPGFRGRHLLYLDKCTGCGICAWICPEKCITFVPLKGEKVYPQNPENRFPQYWYSRCCFCHLCTDYCPTGALDYTPDYELAEYDRELTIWSPERLAQRPEQHKVVDVKIHGWSGASHEPKEEQP